LRLASRGFLCIFGKERHEKSAAAKERNERAAELPIAETVVISSRVRRRKVREIESQPWHILRKDRPDRATIPHPAIYVLRGPEDYGSRPRADETHASHSAGSRGRMNSNSGRATHGDVLASRGGTSHAGNRSSAHASALCGSYCRKNRERSCEDQEAAHDQYLGSRAAGPFLHLHT
jgi:hypothetical protein